MFGNFMDTYEPYRVHDEYLDSKEIGIAENLDIE